MRYSDPAGKYAIDDSSDNRRHGLAAQEPAVDQLITDLQRFANHPKAQEIGQILRTSRNLFIASVLCPLASVYALEVRGVAYAKWMDFVKTGGDMDVKGDYGRDFGDPMVMFGKRWTPQLSGNMLFGFVGKHIEFTEVELYEGAGVGQYGQHCLNPVRKGKKQAPQNMGPGSGGCLPVAPYPPYHVPIPHAWDKPSDQAQIEAGITLYNRYSSLFLSQGNIEEKRKRLAEIMLPFYDRINDSGS